MQWQSLAGSVSALGLAAVGLVIGGGCEPQPQAEQTYPETTSPNAEEMNPSVEINQDPGLDPTEPMG